MKLLSTIIALLVASLCFAQRQNVYYLKNNGKYVDNRDSADYFRVVREPDSASVLYNVFEFYKDTKKKLIGKSTTIDPPKFEGQCVRFYKSGAKQSITNYKNGLAVGDKYAGARDLPDDLVSKIPKLKGLKIALDPNNGAALLISSNDVIVAVVNAA